MKAIIAKNVQSILNVNLPVPELLAAILCLLKYTSEVRENCFCSVKSKCKRVTINNSSLT